MSDAPERIWVGIEQEPDDGDVFQIYDATISNQPMKNLSGDIISVEYIRNDLAGLPEELVMLRQHYADSHAAADRWDEERARLRAEVERLTKCLKQANANHEHFEREWYLRGHEVETLTAQVASIRAEVERLTTCRCRDCRMARLDPSVYPFRREMILCSTCGNKRCPHATNHNHVCTESNDPGQPGSEYAFAGTIASQLERLQSAGNDLAEHLHCLHYYVGAVSVCHDPGAALERWRALVPRG